MKQAIWNIQLSRLPAVRAGFRTLMNLTRDSLYYRASPSQKGTTQIPRTWFCALERLLPVGTPFRIDRGRVRGRESPGRSGENQRVSMSMLAVCQ